LPRNESQPAVPKNSNYFDEATSLNDGGAQRKNIFGKNFEHMLK
jgi:hypothetical protein